MRTTRAVSRHTLFGRLNVDAERNRESETDPVIVIYEVGENQTASEQVPIALAEALTEAYREAELSFVAPRKGLYAVAVFHREKELQRVALHDIPKYHGLRIELT